MKIIVSGCGKIGITVIECLVAEGHDVIAMDKNPAVIAEVINLYDVMGVCGSATDCAALTEAGVEQVEMFVSVTGSDELNMLSCFLAKRMGAKHTIARIRNPEYNYQSLGFLKQQLDISMAINPEFLAAQEMVNILKLPSAAKIETFSRRNFEMVELYLKKDTAWDGVSLSELRRRYDAKFLICIVQRGEEVYIPDGNFVLQAGDRIGFTATPTEIQKLLRQMGSLQKQARNVMILGASRTAFYLAKMLLNSGNTVKIIDADLERCNEFSELLPGAGIIHGEGIRHDVLMEEGLSSVDAFVTLTGIDEENILLSYFASSQNVPKVISKVNSEEFISLAENMGLDSLISPRKIVGDVLTRYARALQNSIGSHVETLYKLMDGKVEALEFNIKSDCSIINTPIKNLQFKKNVLIAGILRSRKTIIPTGDDELLPGDSVIVVTFGHRIDDLTDIVK